MFSEPEHLLTESDVEQKLVWPVLTSSSPVGLGFSAADIVTKLNIRRLEIGKGSNRRIYFPDYLAVLAGLPLLVIEAKAPSESVELSLDEARLYANEINSLLPSGINPCGRVVACNGRRLLSAPVDTAAPDVTLDCGDLSLGHADYARFLELCGRAALQRRADVLRRVLRRDKYVRAVQFVGGETFQNEELPPNTFGATIAGDYGHIFNPRRAVRPIPEVNRETYHALGRLAADVNVIARRMAERRREPGATEVLEALALVTRFLGTVRAEVLGTTLAPEESES